MDNFPESRNLDTTFDADGIISNFERRWVEGKRPSLPGYLGLLARLPTAERHELAIQMVKLDLWWRLKARDDVPLVGFYLHLAGLQLDDEETGELIRLEYQWRWERGEIGLMAADYVKLFPQSQAQLERLMPRWDCSHCGRKDIELESETATGASCPRCRRRYKVEELYRHCSLQAMTQAAAPVELLHFVHGKNLLQAGGMGEIYRIRDLGLGRELAMKVVHPRFRDNPEAERRLFVEAQIAARLDHPGVVPIHSRGWLPDGRAYFTMRLIRGLTLKELLEKRIGDSTNVDLIDIFQQVCRTLKHAHDRRVIHRDLKPDNIMVGADGEIQVLDWGLAKVIDDQSDEGNSNNQVPVPETPLAAPSGASSLQPGVVAGTPLYMAPEQARGETVDTRCDVFALGGILSEILSGLSPYLRDESEKGKSERPSYQELLERARAGDVAAARERLTSEHRDEDLAQIALECLQPDPNRRPTSAGSVAERIHAWRVRRDARDEAQRRDLVRTRAVAVSLIVIALIAVCSLLWINDALDREQAANLQVRKQIIKSRTTAGILRLNEGEDVLALPHFAAALRDEQGDSERAMLDKMRIAWILRTAPKPDQVLALDGMPGCIELSRDGKHVVTATPKRVCIWDAESGSEVTPELPHPNVVYQASFNPDGTRLLTAGRFTGVRVWDINRRTLLCILDPGTDVRSFSFSADGKRVVTAGQGSAVVWDLATAQQIGTLSHDERLPINFAAFSSDGELVVTAGEDATARIWNVNSGRLVGRPLSHVGPLRQAEFDRLGKRVVTSCGCEARIWDAVTCTELTKSPLWHEHSLRSVKFSSDDRQIVTVTDRDVVHYWDSNTGAPLKVIDEHGKLHADPTLQSVDRRRFTDVRGDGAVRIYDLARQETQPVILTHDRGPIDRAIFSPNGGIIATAGGDNYTGIWDAETGNLLRRLRHDGAVRALAFSPDAKWLATGSVDGKTRLWDVGSGELVGSFNNNSPAVNCLAFSADASVVVSAGKDGRVVLLDAQSMIPLGVPLIHQAAVNSVAISPDSRCLLTSSDDGAARLWEMKSYQPVGTVLRHESDVLGARFSSDGVRIITFSRDKTARVWNTSTGLPSTGPLPHNAAVVNAAFSPDGNLVLTACEDGTAQLWDVTSGLPSSPGMRHSAALNEATLSPDGQWVVTAGADNAARLWSARTGEAVTGNLRHMGPVLRAEFSPEGKRFLTASGDGQVMIWTLPSISAPTEDWITMAEMMAGQKLTEQEAVLPLSSLDVQSAWRRLREKHPDQFATSDSMAAAYHRTKLEVCEERGSWNSALGHVNRLMELHPDDVALRIRRGRALLMTSDLRGALADFDSAISESRDNCDLRILRGRARARSFDWTGAIIDFTAALRDWPKGRPARERIDVLFERAQAYAEVERWHKAASDWTEITRQGSLDARLWEFRAIAALAGQESQRTTSATGDYDTICSEMFSNFREAIDPEVELELAWTGGLAPLKDEQLRSQALTIALQLLREKPYDMRRRAISYISLYRSGKSPAKTDLDRWKSDIQRLAPEPSALYWFVLALLYGHQSDSVSANEAFSEAVQILRKQKPAYEMRPWHERIVISKFRTEAHKLLGKSAGLTSLHVAVLGNEVDEALNCLRSGCDVNERNTYGHTSLSLAAGCGHREMTRLLLDHQADPNLPDDNGDTPLHRAIQQNKVAVIPELLKKADINARDRRGATPLILAIQRRHGEIVDELLKHSPDLKAIESATGWTALTFAVLDEDVGLVTKLLKAGANIDGPNRDTGTALHIAIKLRLVGAVRLLLENHAALGSADEQGLTPLHMAVAILGDENVVRLLIKSGAELETKTNWGATALSLAAIKGNEAIVKILLDANADKEARENHGNTPLQSAVVGKHATVVRLLLGQKADIDARDNIGMTALHLACLGTGDASCVRCLLDAGASTELKDKRGYTALHYAAGFGNGPITRLLLNRGAKPNSVDAGRDTPLHVVVLHPEQTNLEVVRALLSAGADPNVENRRGTTPFQYACLLSDLSVVRLMLEYHADAAARDKNARSAAVYAVRRIASDKASPSTVVRIFGCLASGNADGLFVVASALVKDQAKDEIVRLVLERNSTLEAADQRGRTVLHETASAALLNETTLLLERGANCGAVDNEGFTPLHLCANAGATGCARQLLKHGAPIDAKANGLTPLHLAVIAGRADMVKILLSSRPPAEIEAKNAVGDTPLQLAVRCNQMDSAKVLVDHGANCSTRDERGRTLLHHAVITGNRKLVDLFKSRTNTSATDNSGATAADLARRYGDTVVAESLRR
jgi:WD40 repeat protein/ankyrin repeat protein/serine/threonine protein kinase